MLSEDQEQAIYAALYAGRKIEAIGLHRAATGAGLADSKAFIDELEAQLRQESPQRFTAAPAKGCTVRVGVFLVLVLFIAAGCV